MSKLTIYNADDDSYSSVEEPQGLFTYADYLTWQFEERLELFRGQILKLSAPNKMHQQVCLNLGSALHQYLRGKNCQAFIAPFDVRLPVKNKKKDYEVTTVVQPDVCVVCDETKLDERGCCGAPDLIVEILSPGNSKKEIKLKHELYEEAGVKEYWIVFPAEETVAVYHLQENGKFDKAEMFAGNDTLCSKPVTGFCISLNEIFS